MHAALVQRPCSCIRRLAGGRARQMQFTRLLRNPAVTPAEMSAHAAEGTAGRDAGEGAAGGTENENERENEHGRERLG